MRGIYELRFDNGQCYIGLSSAIHTRISKHLRTMQIGEHDNKYVQECYNRYGPPQFKILRFGEFSQKELEALESECITKYIQEGVPLLNIAKNSKRPSVAEIAVQEKTCFSDKVKSLMMLKNIRTLEQEILHMEIELLKAKDKLDNLCGIMENMCVPLTREEERAIDSFSILLK